MFQAALSNYSKISHTHTQTHPTYTHVHLSHTHPTYTYIYTYHIQTLHIHTSHTHHIDTHISHTYHIHHKHHTHHKHTSHTHMYTHTHRVAVICGKLCPSTSGSWRSCLGVWIPGLLCRMDLKAQCRNLPLHSWPWIPTLNSARGSTGGRQPHGVQE